MTHLQAKRISQFTSGYREDADFPIVVEDDGTLFLYVYNLVYRVSPDGHGMLTGKTSPDRVLDRF